MKIEFQIIDKIKKKKYRKVYEGTERPVVIGRSNKSDIVLDDEKVSGSHCEIVIEDNRIYVVDKGSSNGTFVNKKKIEKAEIEIDELVSLRNYKFKVSNWDLDRGEVEKNAKESSNDDSEEDDFEDDLLADAVGFLTDTLKSFIKNPGKYLDKVSYQNVELNSSLPILGVCSFVSSIPTLVSTPLLGIFYAILGVASILGFCFACKLTKNFTKIKATHLQVLHFLCSLSVICLISSLLSLIPYIGIVGIFLALVFAILGIKGFFKSFKPKIIPMIIVTFLYGISLGIVTAPVATLLTPKAKQNVDTKGVEKMMMKVLQKVQKN